eukprot:2339009-Amphidinium_carterae.1
MVTGKPAKCLVDPHCIQSRSQRVAWTRIEEQCSSWIRLGSGPRSGLGRAQKKFDDLGATVESLRSALHDLARSESQYLQHFEPSARQVVTPGPGDSDESRYLNPILQGGVQVQTV